MAIVAPDGDRSIAITRACLDRAAFLSAGDFATAASGALGGVARPSLDFGKRFLPEVLEGFGIGISIGSRGQAPHHRSPTSAIMPAGQDPWALVPGTGLTTAPIADECQSFLDNVVALIRAYRIIR